MWNYFHISKFLIDRSILSLNIQSNNLAVFCHLNQKGEREKKFSCGMSQGRSQMSLIDSIQNPPRFPFEFFATSQHKDIRKRRQLHCLNITSIDFSIPFFIFTHQLDTSLSHKTEMAGRQAGGGNRYVCLLALG